MSSEASRRGFLFVALGCQQGVAQRHPKFSVSVREVNLVATVRDQNGRYVTDLEKGDFVLREDGRTQTIRYFSSAARLSLTVGLLVDASRSQQRLIAEERKAGVRILDALLRDGTDRAFVLSFHRSIQLRQHPTANRNVLHSAVNDIAVPGLPATVARGSGSPVASECVCATESAQTKLHDAIVQSSNELMRGQKPRKVMVVLSDGVDVGSQASLDDAIAAAQAADTTIYTVRFSQSDVYQHNVESDLKKRQPSGLIARPSARQITEEGRAALQRIAAETGGAFFQVSEKQTPARILHMIQQELLHSYAISYYSDQPEADSRYRKITLETRKNVLTVRTRDGYYAGN